MRAVVHGDKPISVETVKLLGLPFSLRPHISENTFAFKFVPTEYGLRIYMRVMVQGQKYEPWEQSESDRAAAILRKLLTEPIYRVTFPDELGINPPCK